MESKRNGRCGLWWRMVDKGHTLLEFMVSLAIISLMALSLVSLQNSMLKHTAAEIEYARCSRVVTATLSRLQQTLVNATEVVLISASSSQSLGMRLELTTDKGRSWLSYYFDKRSLVFYEERKWPDRTDNSGYKVPLSTGIEYMEVGIERTERDTYVHVTVRMGSLQRSITGKLRNYMARP